MASGQDLRKYSWKKGQSGNPKGRPPDDPEVKKLSNLTKEELKEIGTLVVKGNMKALRAIAADPKATAIQTMMAAVAVKIITKGDMNALDLLLNRLIGKVKDEVSHMGLPDIAPQVILTLPSNGSEKA